MSVDGGRGGRDGRPPKLVTSISADEALGPPERAADLIEMCRRGLRKQAKEPHAAYVDAAGAAELAACAQAEPGPALR